MWGRGKSHRSDPVVSDEAKPLRDAMRDARIEAAERTGVVVDLRDAEVARLELLNEELDPVFAEIPDRVDLFDRGLSRGDTPRLWIDAIAHIEMGRDKRIYRFVQDSRFRRQVLAESSASTDIVDVVTKYIARRLIERERALAEDELSNPPRLFGGPGGSCWPSCWAPWLGLWRCWRPRGLRRHWFLDHDSACRLSSATAPDGRKPRDTTSQLQAPGTPSIL